jgi:hypothetical protein
MIKVPLFAVPNQTAAIVLNGQSCEIALRQNGANMYFDLRADGVDIILCRIVRNKQLLCIDARYQPFVGDFIFNDSQGDTQPDYSGLGDRYTLYYLEPSELGQL